MTNDVSGASAEAEQALVSDQAASRLAPSGFDPSRISEAVERIEPNVLAPLIRKAADDFYGHVMDASQDYLRDNMEHNLKAHLAMLERDNATMRRELYEIGEIIGVPWDGHETRLENLRAMAKAKAELTVLRYEMAFGKVSL